MHPDKFLKRARQTKPGISDAEKAERLLALGTVIAGKRKDAVDARKASGIEDVWLACEEAYLGIDDMNRHEFAGAKWAKPSSMTGPLTSVKLNKDDSRSNAYVRLSSRYADNAAAKLCEILLPIDDKAFSFEPTPDPDLVTLQEDNGPLIDGAGQQVMTTPTDGQPPVPKTISDHAKEIMAKASDCADKAEQRVYDWMTESKYPAEARKVINDASRIGVGVLKGPFPDVQKSRAVTKAQGGIVLKMVEKIVPAQRWVDAWNIFPSDACGEDIHQGDEFLERDFLSTKSLKNLKGQPGYLDDQIELVITQGPGKVYAEGGNPNDKKNRKRFEIWYYYGTLRRDDMALVNAVGIDELPDDQEEVHAIVSLVNDTVIRAIINPLESGAFPYRVMTWSRRPGHWAGVGPIEQMSTPQRMVNASTRALLNNAGLSSGIQIIIDQGCIVPADTSWKITPNKIWYKSGDSGSEDVSKAFHAVVIPSVQKEMMAIIEYGMRLAEESTGIPLITQGQTGPDSPETFGAAELQNNNAHTWLRSVGYRFDDQITEPLVKDYYEWLLLDPEVPDDERGDFQINAHGSIAMVERAIQEQTFLAILQSSGNPAFNIDPAKAFAEYLKAKRLDPRKIQLSDEDKAKRDAQPPAPPIPIAVAQIRAQSAEKIQAADAQTAAQLQEQEAQAEMQRIQAEAEHEQGLLQSGGTQPHMAAATAQIEKERIRAQTAMTVESSRAHAEESRASKEMLIAQQNGQYEIQKMQLQKDLAVLEYAQKHQLTLEQVKADLAKTAMQEETKRQLASTEQALAVSEGDKNRVVDVHKHHTSLVKDQMSTPETP